MKVAKELQEKEDGEEAAALIAAEDAGEEEPKGEPVTKYIKGDVAK